MAVHDYARTLRRRWRLVVAGVLIGVATATIVAVATPRQYESTSELLVSAEATDDQLAANQGSTFVQSRVKSYVAVVTSPAVLAATRTALAASAPSLAGLSDAELRSRLRVGTQPDASLIDITAADGSGTGAAALANAVSQSFATVVRDFETPAGATTSAVKVLTTSPAVASAHPARPDVLVDIAVGLLAGLLVGLAAAALRERLDVSISSPELLVTHAGAPVLATIVADPQLDRRPMPSRAGGHSARVEGFRQLRTNLQFVDIDRPPRVIAVTSPMPGEGKTAVAVNIAATLADGGARVCLVDTDLRRPAIAETLGLVGGVGLTTVLIGRADLRAAFQPVGTELTVLAAGPLPPNPSELLASNQMRDLVRELARQFEAVVLDTSPLLPVADGAEVATIADGTLLIARWGSTTFAQVRRSVEALARVDARMLGTILNRVPSRQATAYGFAYYGRRASAHGHRLADRRAEEATNSSTVVDLGQRRIQAS